VLFERICRENGITQRLTQPASPTTTGKIERLHQSLQNELLNDHGPFASIEHLQAVLDAWREEYNTDRPHQSLGMAFPASRFGSALSELELRIPARQGLTAPPDSVPAPAAAATEVAEAVARPRVAVETDRLVAPSGNLWIGGQQIWLARLAADGARPAGPPPLHAGTGTAVEVERLVNGTSLVGLAGRQLNVGYELAGQRVTLRMDGTQMAVISHDGTLLRTIPCPVPAADRHRLRGARRAASMPAPATGPVVVQRRVSQRGSIMVATQRIHVGLIHARKIVTVTASHHSFRLDIAGETVGTVPRTTSREIHRYKAYATKARKP
jgi:Integrase core domain